MHTIVVALDLSPQTRAVLDVGVALARAQRCGLHVLHVVPHPGAMGLEAYSVGEAELHARASVEARTRLEAHLRSIPGDVAFTEEVRTGFPWEEILNAAAVQRAARIIVGAHGYNLVERMMGTTAERVVNHASCPVVVVRAPEVLLAG